MLQKIPMNINKRGTLYFLCIFSLCLSQTIHATERRNHNTLVVSHQKCKIILSSWSLEVNIHVPEAVVSRCTEFTVERNWVACTSPKGTIKYVKFNWKLVEQFPILDGIENLQEKLKRWHETCHEQRKMHFDEEGVLYKSVFMNIIDYVITLKHHETNTRSTIYIHFVNDAYWNNNNSSCKKLKIYPLFCFSPKMSKMLQSRIKKDLPKEALCNLYQRGTDFLRKTNSVTMFPGFKVTLSAVTSMIWYKNTRFLVIQKKMWKNRRHNLIG